MTQTTPSTSAQGPVRVLNDNGKRWRVESADGRWEIKPTGHIDADEARNICKRVAAALTASPSPAASDAPQSGVDAKALRGIIARWDSRREFLNTNPSAKDAFIAQQLASLASATPAPPPLYAARVFKGLPTDCCDYGVVSLNDGREICRVWEEKDARAIASALARSPAPTSGGEDGGEPATVIPIKMADGKGGWTIAPETLEAIADKVNTDGWDCGQWEGVEGVLLAVGAEALAKPASEPAGEIVDHSGVPGGWGERVLSESASEDAGGGDEAAVESAAIRIIRNRASDGPSADRAVTHARQFDTSVWRDAKRDARAALSSSAGPAEPVGWMHTLHMEFGQTSVRLTDDVDEKPFGEPERDYSASYPITVTPLYAHPAPVAVEISHANCNVPGWEYATTTGPRKSWDAADTPPEGDGWERNIDEGRKGWERFEYHEESYWRRPAALAPATEGRKS